MLRKNVVDLARDSFGDLFSDSLDLIIYIYEVPTPNIFLTL